MTISAEDLIIHHLKDKVGLAKADGLVAALKGEQGAGEIVQEAREEALRLAAAYLRKKYGVTNRAAGDLLRLAELEAQGRSALAQPTMSSPRGAVARVAEHDLMTPADLVELTAAVDRGDAEAVRSIGHHWSGLIALDVFSVADAIDTTEQ